MPTTSYESLVEEISQIHETALVDGDANCNKSVLVSNWKIGERIVEVEQNKDFRAKYGEKIIQTLAKDLNRKLGSGFSARNLRYMRKFYTVYKKQNINPLISWSHYRELVSVEDKNERIRLENLVALEQISVRDLIQILNQSKGYEFETENGSTSREEESENGKNLLRKPVLQLFTYRVDRKFSMNLAHSVPNLDLGFRIKYELGDYGLDRFKSGDLVSVRKSRKSFHFDKIAAVRELFTYKAYLDRVIDGDTLLVHVDLGFSIFIQQRLRLRGIDAPDLETPTGKQAKKFVELELKEAKCLIIKTYGTDLYDRYLVDVFYLPDEDKIDIIKKDGLFLNNRLLQEGLVVRYP